MEVRKGMKLEDGGKRILKNNIASLSKNPLKSIYKAIFEAVIRVNTDKKIICLNHIYL